MLDAYFSIKPKPNAPAPRVTSVAPGSPPVDKAKKRGRPGKSKAPLGVEPYDTSTVHARFKPSAAEPEPRGLVDACVLDCEPLGELALEDQQGVDQYEYLWQEANASTGQTEDDDTDSCATYDDAASDTVAAEQQYGTSPADCSLESAFVPRLKPKPSEAPVYSGPELWFEEDDYIE